jgi:hypothetical protein
MGALLNSADDATCITVKQFNTDSQWFKGPDFLKVSSNEWPQESKTDNDGECDNFQGLETRHLRRATHPGASRGSNIGDGFWQWNNETRSSSYLQ